MSPTGHLYAALRDYLRRTGDAAAAEAHGRALFGGFALVVPASVALSVASLWRRVHIVHSHGADEATIRRLLDEVKTLRAVLEWPELPRLDSEYATGRWYRTPHVTRPDEWLEGYAVALRPPHLFLRVASIGLVGVDVLERAAVPVPRPPIDTSTVEERTRLFFDSVLIEHPGLRPQTIISNTVGPALLRFLDTCEACGFPTRHYAIPQAPPREEPSPLLSPFCLLCGWSGGLHLGRRRVAAARLSFRSSGLAVPTDSPVGAVLSEGDGPQSRARAATLFRGIRHLDVYTPYHWNDADGTTALAWATAHRLLRRVRQHVVASGMQAELFPTTPKHRLAGTRAG